MKKRVWVVGIVLGLLCLIGIIGIDRTYIQGEEETRQLYIGDLLQLQIEAQGISEEELIAIFSDFEIVDQEHTGDTYQLTIRTFKPGDYALQIGGQPLDIHVGSTLKDYPQDDIFRIEAKQTPDWRPVYRILLYVSGLIFIISSMVYAGYVLRQKKKRKRKQQDLTPYEQFYSTLDHIETVDRQALGIMTKAFKTYLTQISGCSFVGLSTKECYEQLGTLPHLAIYAQDIHRWMTWCDTYKYSKKPLDHDDSEALYKNILAMAKHMYDHGIVGGEEAETCSSNI